MFGKATEVRVSATSVQIADKAYPYNLPVDTPLGRVLIRKIPIPGSRIKPFS
jgi:hypothetical protein